MVGVCGAGSFGPIEDGWLSPCFAELLALAVRAVCLLLLAPALLRLASAARRAKPAGYLQLDPPQALAAAELAALRSPEAYAQLTQRAAEELQRLEGKGLGRLSLLVGLVGPAVRAAELWHAEQQPDRFTAMSLNRAIATAGCGVVLAVLLLESWLAQARTRAVLCWWVADGLCGAMLVRHWLLQGWATWTGLTIGLCAVQLAVVAVHLVRRQRSELSAVCCTVWMLARRPGQSQVLRLLRLGAKDWPVIAAGLAGFTSHAMCRLWVAVLYGKLIDAVYTDKDSSVVLAEFAAASVLMGLFDAAGGVSLELAGARLGARLRRFTFEVMVEQDIEYFESHKTGKLMSILSNNVNDVQSCLTFQLADAFEGLVTSLVLLCYMFIKGPRLAAVFLGITMVPLTVGIITGHVTERFERRVKEQQAVQNGVSQEQLSSMHTVKSFGKEEHSKSSYSDAVQATYKVQLRQALAESLLEGLSDTGFCCVIVGCFYYGIASAEHDEASRAFFVSFMVLANQAIDNLQKTFEAVPEFARALGSSHKIFEVFDRIALLPYRGGLQPCGLEGHIRLEQVDFSYPSRPERLVLHGMDLELPVGTHLALVGASGCGKSSIISLVARLWDPTGGSVLLDGLRMSLIDPQWLHQRIAVVLQEPCLFSGTVRQNILFGARQPQLCTDEAIQTAAQQAYAHQFILGMPQGYDTILGERGVSVSGGQKQRLAIARALLRRPELLLLDEATSALDSESELEVQNALQGVMRGKTMLVAAHRMSSIAHCDKVAVIENGTLAEIGSHSELIALGGKFAKMVMDKSEDGDMVAVQECTALLRAHQRQTGLGADELEAALKCALAVIREEQANESSAGPEDGDGGSTSDSGSGSSSDSE